MDVITKLYQSLGYIEVHGIDLLITIVAIITTLLITGYTTYIGLLAKLRADWDNQRCMPIVLPFAGYIMPVPGKTNSEVTSENAQYCFQKDAAAVFSIALMPLEFSLYTTVEFLDSIEEGIRSTMNTIRYIMNKLADEKNKLYNRVASFVVPVVEILLYLRDALAKANGVMVVALYTVMNIYNIIVSGSINLMKVLSNLIIAVTAVMLALVIVALILIPSPATFVGLAMYSSAVVMLVATIIPNIVIYTFMRLFINQISPERPSKPPKTPKLKKKKKK
jgi:hypothetical protein